MAEIIVFKTLDGLDAGLAHAQNIQNSEPDSPASR